MNMSLLFDLSSLPQPEENIAVSQKDSSSFCIVILPVLIICSHPILLTSECLGGQQGKLCSLPQAQGLNLTNYLTVQVTCGVYFPLKVPLFTPFNYLKLSTDRPISCQRSMCNMLA